MLSVEDRSNRANRANRANRCNRFDCGRHAGSSLYGSDRIRSEIREHRSLDMGGGNIQRSWADRITKCRCDNTGRL